MIADLNVHWDIGADGQPKPHAHVMLTMREVGKDGFGAKVRDWNKAELVEQWRERWADHVNERLAELDIDARIDHRSLEAQGIALEPQDKIGPAASRMGVRGLEAERIEEHRAVAQRNGERIIANPAVALDAITHSRPRSRPRPCHVRASAQRRQRAVRSGDERGARLARSDRAGQGRTRRRAVHLATDDRDRAAAWPRIGIAGGERERHQVEDRGREGALARAAERGA
jgi:hypothetical protein